MGLVSTLLSYTISLSSSHRDRDDINTPTTWIIVLCEKLIVTQLVKKFPAFYTTRKFITLFTRARYWSLSWARQIQSTHSQPFHYVFTVKLCRGGKAVEAWNLPLISFWT